jgi:hypothetical protein
MTEWYQYLITEAEILNKTIFNPYWTKEFYISARRVYCITAEIRGWFSIIPCICKYTTVTYQRRKPYCLHITSKCWPGTVAHPCDPRYSEDIGWMAVWDQPRQPQTRWCVTNNFSYQWGINRIIVQDQSQEKSARPSLRNKVKQNILKAWLKILSSKPQYCQERKGQFLPCHHS